jgi:DNA-binding CsgD family transcriptional regulator
MLQQQPYDYNYLAAQPTPRELEVLGLICEGDSLKDIANTLHISIKTAACHRSRLLGKSGAKNSIQLFRWALNHGYVRLERIQPRMDDARSKDISIRDMLNLSMDRCLYGHSVRTPLNDWLTRS